MLTARNVKTLGTVALVRADLNEPLSYENGDGKIDDLWQAIAPGTSVTLVSTSPWAITSEAIADLVLQRALLFHYGRGYYENDAGKEFSFEFCDMFDPGTNRVVPCPETFRPRRAEVSIKGPRVNEKQGQSK